ncbi:BREX-2 system phosphatase PglZ [Nocardia blacklockiae]|uniref:BREX-2 system phosphatase PglZ n=1 Tax=Nocardia blacklockiae TaxID=480036 RepID=UPI001892F6BB|nr:BREX-2 system phosphatase PglZ [Nocardia blacklockiae]MBF6175292.1 BREX-2 system phosphatase PglZ [Nocardia blacklockiae]
MSAPATDTVTTLPRLKTADVAQYLSAAHGLVDALEDRGERTVVLLRAEPAWAGPAELAIGERRARVAPAPSALAVHELVLRHLGTDDAPKVLVVLTDREHEELDPAILARTHRKRINLVDRWEIVRNAFGSIGIDEWIKREPWAAEALLDAAGPNGWPRVPGVLSRGEALFALASRRLRLPSSDTDRIDPATLLHWSRTPGAPELLLDLRDAERDGLTTFLTDAEQAGAAGSVLIDLIRAGHGGDAVAFGLVAAALWLHPDPDGATYQARGRAERRLGDRPAISADELDRRMTTFGRACLEYFDVQLARAYDPRARAAGSQLPERAGDTPWSESARAARQIVDPILRRAGELVHELGADAAARTSPVLRAGLDACFAAVGNALGRNDSAAVAHATEKLFEHRLAGDPELAVRIGRIEMAQRLARWLADDPDITVDTVSDALDRHMRETGWVDRALDYLEAGGDTDPALKTPYRTLANNVRRRRRDLDREFAKSLATWTASGTDPGRMLTVESFLTRVVAPIAAHRRVLLLVLDGMSTAIATELADQLLSGWNEYDPCPDGGEPRRRAMAAALPSLTALSRTSLFAGKLMRGDQNDEKREFARHRFWGAKKTAAVFHLDDLRGESGQPYGDDLTAALLDPDQHIAVVLNTIDNALDKNLKLGDPDWEVREIGDLHALLRAGADQGMAVLITSDHGHVIDRHSVKVEVDEWQSARHRYPDTSRPLADTEIALSGPRVLWPRPDEPDSAIVALWDNDSRYTTRKAGYHGGASLAEVTIPILAFLPFGVEPPTVSRQPIWRQLGPQSPYWWSSDRPAPAAVQAHRAAPARRRAIDHVAKERLQGIEPMFDLPETPTATSPFTSDSAEDDLVTRLLESDAFAGQRALLARPPQSVTVDKAIRALLQGPLPITALAQRVGYPSIRASGFAAILGQLLNFDGIIVLETLGDGRTLKLDAARLRAQFGL